MLILITCDHYDWSIFGYTYHRHQQTNLASRISKSGQYQLRKAASRATSLGGRGGGSENWDKFRKLGGDYICFFGALGGACTTAHDGDGGVSFPPGTHTVSSDKPCPFKMYWPKSVKSDLCKAARNARILGYIRADMH